VSVLVRMITLGKLPLPGHLLHDPPHGGLNVGTKLKCVAFNVRICLQFHRRLALFCTLAAQFGHQSSTVQ